MFGRCTIADGTPETLYEKDMVSGGLKQIPAGEYNNSVMGTGQAADPLPKGSF